MSEVRGRSGARETKRTRADKIERIARAAVDALLKKMDQGTPGTEPNECYQLVENGADYRLGLAAGERDGLLSVELLVCVLREDAELEVAVLTRTLRVAGALRDRGYKLAHQGDGWISCDRSIPRKKAARECRTLLGLLVDNGFGRTSALQRWTEEENVDKGV